MWQNLFDLAIVLTLLYFTFRGIKNGLICEIAGIAGLACAFWAARAWNGALAPWLGFISDSDWRTITACVLIFVAVMLAIAILARLLRKLAAFSLLGGVDKFLGAILGLAKGIIIWSLIILVLQKLFNNPEFLRDSRIVPYFGELISQIRDWLPAGWYGHA